MLLACATVTVFETEPMAKFQCKLVMHTIAVPQHEQQEHPADVGGSDEGSAFLSQ